ncbi:SAM-dependent methyltransferase [Streptomyces sp. NPDC047108]|uniref:SAM-dependent methyltransferase n=1 Tax=Streptomyces sp. NPDC047108 TaxID=3155025 RepID=UPI0033C7D753
MTAREAESVRIDTSRPHPARVYDWLLGGKDNYPVDEALAQQILGVDANAAGTAKANRAFMHRATRWLAGTGISQYLDIGTGIPTEPNLHQVAQGIAPAARIVYADNDPIVLRHAEALLRSAPEGTTDYIQADVRDPGLLTELAGRVLDLSRPVALSLIGLLHFVPDEDDAYGLVRSLLDALAPGSHLVLSHVTGDFDPASAERVVALYGKGGVALRPRTRAEVAVFFDGLELVDPGLTPAPHWHPELGDGRPDAPGREPVPVYAAVARKP